MQTQISINLIFPSKKEFLTLIKENPAILNFVVEEEDKSHSPEITDDIYKKVMKLKNKETNEKYAQYRKDYYQKNKEYIKERNTKINKKNYNPQKAKEYYQKNKDKIKAKYQEQKQQKQQKIKEKQN